MEGAPPRYWLARKVVIDDPQVLDVDLVLGERVAGDAREGLGVRLRGRGLEGARDAWDRRRGEDAQERQDRVLQRARGDRYLYGYRNPGRSSERCGDGEARPLDPS
jgi:hypothetical protein